MREYILIVLAGNTEYELTDCRIPIIVTGIRILIQQPDAETRETIKPERDPNLVRQRLIPHERRIARDQIPVLPQKLADTARAPVALAVDILQEPWRVMHRHQFHHARHIEDVLLGMCRRAECLLDIGDRRDGKHLLVETEFRRRGVGECMKSGATLLATLQVVLPFIFRDGQDVGIISYLWDFWQRLKSAAEKQLFMR